MNLTEQSKQHLTKDDLIHKLKMQKLEPEGGYYARQSESLLRVEVPFGTNGEMVNRSLMTSIFYLVTDDSFSAFHRLKGCETYHFYMGARLEVNLIYPDGQFEVKTLGADLASGDQLQIAVDGGVWQASRILPGETLDWSLVGTTCAPGFEFEDYKNGHRAGLIVEFPQHADLIRELTRS